jgi:hypothetical protein
MANDRIALPLRVLGYQVDKNTWTAHCLETDLVGYGKSFKQALDDLVVRTEMQVSFALQTNQPSLLDKPAAGHLWELYNRFQREAIQRYNSRKMTDDSHRVANISLPSKSHLLDSSFVEA